MDPRARPRRFEALFHFYIVLNSNDSNKSHLHLNILRAMFCEYTLLGDLTVGFQPNLEVQGKLEVEL